MDRVRDVGPHPTVQVLGGVHRALAALGGLPLGTPAASAASRPVSKRQAAFWPVTRMASMSMAPSATRSIVAWNVERGRPN